MVICRHCGCDYNIFTFGGINYFCPNCKKDVRIKNGKNKKI